MIVFINGLNFLILLKCLVLGDFYEQLGTVFNKIGLVNYK